MQESQQEEPDKQGNSRPEKLPDADLTRQQKEALQRLEQVIAAVKSQLDAPPPQPQKQPNNPPEGDNPPEDGPPPPQNGLPPIAQLKLLKALQLDVNKRSEEFKKQHPELNKLSDAGKTEYNSIIRDQQDVREAAGGNAASSRRTDRRQSCRPEAETRRGEEEMKRRFLPLFVFGVCLAGFAVGADDPKPDDGDAPVRLKKKNKQPVPNQPKDDKPKDDLPKDDKAKDDPAKDDLPKDVEPGPARRRMRRKSSNASRAT